METTGTREKASTGGSGSMHRRRRGWTGSEPGSTPVLWTGLVMAALAATGIPAAALQAQDPGERPDTLRSCRCIGADGEVIEGCRCVMRGEGWAMAFGEGGPDVRVWSHDFGEGLAETLARPTPWAWESTPRVWENRSDRARLGVLVTVEQEAQYESEGVHLQEVTEGSPAWEAGLRDGDVVVSIDGRSVLEPLPDAEEEDAIDRDRSVPVQRFLALADALEPGEEVEVGYLRDGDRRSAAVVPERMRSVRLFGQQGDFRVRLDTLEGNLRFGPGGVHVRGLRDLDTLGDFEVLREQGDFFEPRGDIRIRGLGDRELDVVVGGLDPCFGTDERNVVYALGSDRCVDGLRLQDLNPQLGEYFGVERGVLVTEVLERSSLGLRAGDVIRSIGGRTVDDAEDVRRILRSYETDEPVEMVVVRRGERTEVRGTRRAP